VRSTTPLHLLDCIRLGPDRGNAIRVWRLAAQLAVTVTHERPSTGGELVDGELLQGFTVGVVHAVRVCRRSRALSRSSHTHKFAACDQLTNTRRVKFWYPDSADMH
jgi:hypothetical protein